MRWFILLTSLLVSALEIYPQPAPRHLERIAFSEALQQLSLFGGFEFPEAKPVLTKTLWNRKDGWSETDTVPLAPRWASALAYNENALYVFGGYGFNAAGNEHLFNDLWSYKSGWKKLSDGPNLEIPQLFANDGRLLLAGKSPGSDRDFEIWEYAADGLTHIKTVKTNYAGGTIHMVSHNSDVYLAFFKKDTLEMHGLLKGVHVATLKIPTVSKFSFTYHPPDSCFYLFGGISNNDTTTNAMWSLSGKGVEPVRFLKGPSPRSSAQMISTSNGLLLYGGTKADGKLSNELWRFEHGTWIKLD